MYIKKTIIDFWHGNISLWKSYWIVGELINSFIIIVFYNIEIKYFNNNLIYKTIPFLNFNDFHFLNKIILLLWTTFITIGIWRSAEKYNGKFIWIALTLIILSYRIYILRIIFY